MEKRLYRSRDNRMVAGVCGGMAEYFNIDPTVARILWVIAGLLGGSGVLAYIVALIIMPLDPGTSYSAGESDNRVVNEFDNTQGDAQSDEWSKTKKAVNYDAGKSRLVFGGILIILGIFFLLKQFEVFNFITSYKITVPTVFIAIGLLIIFRGRRR